MPDPVPELHPPSETDGLTRRALVARGGVAAGVMLGSGALARAASAVARPRAASATRPATVPLAPQLRKCVSLGPRGTLSPGSDQDYRTNRAFLLAPSNDTKWVKLWVVWPALQPAQQYAPGVDPPASLLDPEWGVTPSQYLAGLDAQVQQAAADGRHIILTCWLYPLWSNAQARSQYASLLGSRNPRYGFPDRTDPASPYGQMLRFLMKRYGNLTTVMIEISNEPNLNCFPQSGAPGVLAAMMTTASSINNALGGPCLLGAPATADVTGGGNFSTSYSSFTTALLSALPQAGFRSDPSFIWTHHNYSDCEHGISPPRAVTVRNDLVSRWNGMGGPLNPLVFLTEGGVSLSTYAHSSQQTQATMLQSAIANINNGSSGIGMFTNYLAYSDTGGNDTGLLDRLSAGGAPRLAAEVWNGLPGLY